MILFMEIINMEINVNYVTSSNNLCQRQSHKLYSLLICDMAVVGVFGHGFYEREN